MPPDLSPQFVPAPPSSPALSSLSASYKAGSRRIRETFAETGRGTRALQERSDLVDGIVLPLYQDILSASFQEPRGLCLLALGGYGRRELFPYSDIDLLLLVENEEVQAAHREAIAALLRALWDLRMRLGHTIRTLAECGRLHRNNLEFNMALLDIRYLAGDLDLYSRLRADVIPHLVARDGEDLIRNLTEMTARRHARYGNTIFHLEPNVKEVPGGLRDFHVCRWLLQIGELEKKGRWTPSEELWSARDLPAARAAWEFLADVRCFVHYFYSRDDNQLSYEAQDQASARGIGVQPGGKLAPADWMRHYFREARAIQQLATQCLEEAAPARSGLYALYQDWRSRLSNADFSVVRGRIFARHPDAIEGDPFLLLRLFEMVARHGLPLSRETGRWVEAELMFAPGMVWPSPGLWQHFRPILLAPHAGEVLREMHRLGLLDALFPEFRAIDSLVVRDFYHRYTVDEHSFTAIEKVQGLLAQKPTAEHEEGTGPGAEWKRRFGEVLAEVERPDLLFLTLLFHDIGKGIPGEDHIRSGLQALEGIMERLPLPEEDRKTVRFLTAHHLEMSATCQRRDVFDSETVRTFARTIGSVERLKMLCLLTYADIGAVNPEALTPWKAELVWQLYAATSNYLARSVDDERLRIRDPLSRETEKVLAVLGDPTRAGDLHAFLDGFPQRYTETHTEEEIARHFGLAQRLHSEPVLIDLQPRDRHFELTVVTLDRPRLFTSIAGTLAAWGMSIIKADAFANAAGVVLDEFKFIDLHKALELNPSERVRFGESLTDVLSGREQFAKLLSARNLAPPAARRKIQIATRVHFDRQSSSHATILELVAQDRPGLLYDVSSTLAELGCNIEVALIDTEGQRAIDVFYLTHEGRKLDPALEEAVADALRRAL